MHVHQGQKTEKPFSLSKVVYGCHCQVENFIGGNRASICTGFRCAQLYDREIRREYGSRSEVLHHHHIMDSLGLGNLEIKIFLIQVRSIKDKSASSTNQKGKCGKRTAPLTIGPAKRDGLLAGPLI